MPGPHVVAATPSPRAATTPRRDNLVLNGTVTAIDVTFDRDMEPATFTAADVLRIIGPAGAIAGPFTVTPDPLATDPDPRPAATFRIGFPTQQLSGTYTVDAGPEHPVRRRRRRSTPTSTPASTCSGATPSAGTAAAHGPPRPTCRRPTAAPAARPSTSTITVPDNFVIQGVDADAEHHLPQRPRPRGHPDRPGRHPDPALHQRRRHRDAAASATSHNTIFDDAAATPIQNGGPPFFGRFKPQAAARHASPGRPAVGRHLARWRSPNAVGAR